MNKEELDGLRMVNRGFVLVSTQRSGSTWVADTLNRHPEVRFHGELFVQGGSGVPRRGCQDLVFWEEFLRSGSRSDAVDRSENLFRYLDKIYRRRSKEKAAGFKLMYGQAGCYPGIMDYMRRYGVGVIHLIRRNYLDVILSKECAVKRGVFGANVGEAVEEVEVKLNCGDLIRRLDEQQQDVSRGIKRFRALGVPYAEVYYEALRLDRSLFSTLLEFMGANSYTLPDSRMRKMNIGSHSEMIRNYEEVVACLKGSRYESMIGVNE